MPLTYQSAAVPSWDAPEYEIESWLNPDGESYTSTVTRVADGAFNVVVHKCAHLSGGLGDIIDAAFPDKGMDS